MKTRILLSLLLTTLAFDVVAAPARRTAPATTQTAQRTTAARAATNMRTTQRAPVASKAGTTVSARSAKPVAKTNTTQPKAPTIAARAGTTQKVINAGTKVSSAAKNTTLDTSCQEKYNGCMDAFCMLDNGNGGRCQCSDKVKDLNAALAEIERIDEQSYRMATIGIEQLEMGADADAAIAMAQSVTDKIKNPQSNQGRKLDFSAFDEPVNFNSDIFKSSNPDTLEDKTGNELYTAVSKLCKQQIPECESSLQTIQLLYAQQIKSDCLAYENTIKKKRSQSNEKLLAAERALRETALEQHQTANKYDLSKCTIKFKECMQTTGGCGEDFSGCAVVVATDNTSARNNASGKTKTYKIQGAVSAVEIAASTYDTLIAKKPLCESVTKQCTAVADQVWETFLREAAPQIKSAEIIAEDNARQNCISDISACFQKACRDNIDPNDPDGSYDMCLTRPETMFNVCRIPLNACGIDATKKSTAEKSPVWQHVKSVLSAMRVDACTTQVKQCLQSDDRCGSDYSNCIGLDQEAVMGLCPLEKVVACNSSEYGDSKEKIQEYIYNIAQGVFLSIDNSLLQTCQNAVTNKMMEICGGTDICYIRDVNTELGTGSLQTTQDKDDNYVVSGTLDFNGFKLVKKDNPTPEDYEESKVYKIEYSSNSGTHGTPITGDITSLAKKRIENVRKDFENELNRKFSLLLNDPQVNMCVTGRDVSQIVHGRNRTERTAARFPNLVTPYLDVIYDALLTTVKSNYMRAYVGEVSQANSLSQEYRNMMMCYGMADLTSTEPGRGNRLPDVINTSYGIIGQGPGYIKLSGVSNQDILDLQTGSQNKTRIHYDESVPGQPIMIATEDISAVYEPGPQTCRLTSRLYACTGYEAIYENNSNSSSVGVTAGVSAEGVTVNTGVDTSKASSSTTHSGTFCKQFAEPLISEQIISFKSGEAMFGNVSRSNLLSNSFSSTNVSTINDNSWSFALDANLALDTGGTTNVQGNVDNIDMSTDNRKYVNKKGIQVNGDNNSATLNTGDEASGAIEYSETDPTALETPGERRKRERQERQDANQKAKEDAKKACDNKGSTYEWKGGKCVDKLSKKERAKLNAIEDESAAAEEERYFGDKKLTPDQQQKLGLSYGTNTTPSTSQTSGFDFAQASQDTIAQQTSSLAMPATKTPSGAAGADITPRTKLIDLGSGSSSASSGGSGASSGGSGVSSVGASGTGGYSNAGGASYMNQQPLSL